MDGARPLIGQSGVSIMASSKALLNEVHLSIIGVAMLLAMAALHASGYSDISSTLREADIPNFLKQILPPLFLYPSALLVLLSVAVVVSLKLRTGQAAILGVVTSVVAANAAFGFVLGGPIPGFVLTFAAAVFGVAAWKATRSHSDTPAEPKA